MTPKLSDRERLLTKPQHTAKGKLISVPGEMPNTYYLIGATGERHFRVFCDYCDFQAAGYVDLDAHQRSAHVCADCGRIAALKPWYDYSVKPPTVKAQVCPQCLVVRKKTEYAKRRAVAA